MNKPKNILVVRTDRIGDVILSIPLAGVIKKKYPACKVSFLVKDYTKDLLFSNKFIDEILILKEGDGKVLINENVKMIKAKRFDYAITVYPTFVIALIVFLSKIKNRIGTGYRWYSIFFNKKIYEHRKNAQKHELEYNLNLLSAIGIENIKQEQIEFNIHIDKLSRNKVLSILSENRVDLKKPVILIHPGSGGSSVDLPVSKFKELVSSLDDEIKKQIVLTGSEKEKQICEEIADEKILNTAGKFNLNELTALINEAKIFIANSTGPLHIAAALGLNVIGFYPNNRVTSARRWGPYTDKKVIFQPKTECDDCKKEQCINKNCMNSIEIAKVKETIESLYYDLNGDRK